MYLDFFKIALEKNLVKIQKIAYEVGIGNEHDLTHLLQQVFALTFNDRISTFSKEQIFPLLLQDFITSHSSHQKSETNSPT